MVPPLEQHEFMSELRNIADNILRERWEHVEVHQRGHSMQEPIESADVHKPLEGSAVQESNPDVSGNLGAPVGPAFDIPMTQQKTLEELPSQIDLEWQGSISPSLTPNEATTSAVTTKDTEDNAFAEVQQIAEEAAEHATQHLDEQVIDPPIMSN